MILDDIYCDKCSKIVYTSMRLMHKKLSRYQTLLNHINKDILKHILVNFKHSDLTSIVVNVNNFNKDNRDYTDIDVYECLQSSYHINRSNNNLVYNDIFDYTYLRCKNCVKYFENVKYGDIYIPYTKLSDCANRIHVNVHLLLCEIIKILKFGNKIIFYSKYFGVKFY